MSCVCAMCGYCVHMLYVLCMHSWVYRFIVQWVMKYICSINMCCVCLCCVYVLHTYTLFVFVCAHAVYVVGATMFACACVSDHSFCIRCVCALFESVHLCACFVCLQFV